MGHAQPAQGRGEGDDGGKAGTGGLQRRAETGAGGLGHVAPGSGRSRGGQPHGGRPVGGGGAAPRPPRGKVPGAGLQPPPGALSRLLGYWPAETTDAPPVGVIEAARADPRLGERDRRILTAVYRELVRKQAKDGNI